MAVIKFALFFVVAVLNGGFVFTALDVLPINTAALVGSTVHLECSVIDVTVSRVLWNEFATNPGGPIISDNRTIGPGHPNAARYSILGEDPYFILEIRDLTLADGGTYLCQDINDVQSNLVRAYAELVVLESNPVCTDLIPSNGAVIEGTYYALDCRINFEGILHPAMLWSGPGEYLTNSSTSLNSVTAVVVFTVNREIEGLYFSSETYFTGRIATPPGVAGNAPSYRYVYNSTAFNVTWGPSPTSTFIIPVKSFYEVGDVLRCVSDSKPESAFTWLNLRTFESFAGPAFTITSELLATEQLLRCTALLTLNQVYSADVFLQVNVPVATSPTTAPTTTPRPNPLDCSDVTGRWRATNPNADLCLEVSTRGDVLSLIRNGTDQIFIAGTGLTVYNDNKHIGFSGIWPENIGVAGFVGECHACFGAESLLISGLQRSVYRSQTCGESDGTDLTRLYIFTRVGPPCRGSTLTVHPYDAWIAQQMGVDVRFPSNP